MGKGYLIVSAVAADVEVSWSPFMRFRPLALGVLACASTSSIAFAQDAPIVDNQRQMEIRARADAIHQTNVGQLNKALSLSRGITPEDWTFRPSLQIDVVQPLGRQALFLKGSAGYDFHRRNQQLDRERVDLQGGYLTTLARCRLIAVGGYRAAQSELSDLSNLTSSTKNLLQEKSASGFIDCTRNTGLGAQLTGSHVVSTNTDQLQKQSDATTDTGGVTLAYRNPALGNIAVIGVYAQSDFPNRIVAIGVPPGDDFLVRSLGISLEKKFGSKIKSNIAVSRSLLKRGSAPAGTPLKTSSTTYHADITYRLSSRLEFEAIGDRAIVPSNRVGKLYDVERNAELVGRYKIGPRIMFTAGGRREDVKSNADSTLGPNVITKSRDKIVYGSVRYRQSQRVSYFAELRQNDRITNLPVFDFSDTRLTLSADVAF